MKKDIIKKVITISTISLFFVQSLYLILEPTYVIAASVNDSVVVTLTVDSGITITTPSDVTMAPSFGVAADSSIGSATWNVKTNHATGYSLAVKASASPALVSGANNFADYTEGTPTVPELWSVASGAKEFGYSAYGTDTSTATWGTSASCGSAGVPAAAQKYLGFETTDFTVATRAVVTATTGVDTTVCFAAQQNAVYAASGVYTATITATATEI
ncbi:MAG: hypothetical protein UR85_C0005G0007 [Candidatus Nomurabacteria bacterium GW2011_GWF2_35_66]|uniref:Uncharacterized protein n=1 Tax=Candidatus Nomurabacteria bacterium GW2011_GWE1_35_16 TaxID=1618761 RepID=A0A0G0BAG3_9BACT|nr:MAG: hypothetical protein UR55_C0006G0008 [Candidatus Nomurabacteria bacterium GW2011_GWF1_34_20]KKP63236.1 MAG: hypothetical protein UR57_C0007G0008 [Candidatus Nomurabacteria bacterium GW2011_GWE2_34_25]KKP66438.1 MAG: hypothetical protein UR64_C0007G0007 [Candidatus Nomurabacteria bacterium GW2011_GWE1_35_16]KKP83332.1 MAG: hypothetical protein UR85_C0005G0007 [Candidatus Nomurabacteria bacterium GW2011_GWF2_35_66]HAE36485.1 hypothetical protein [Candidatus Nomurabacteria bacterium]